MKTCAFALIAFLSSPTTYADTCLDTILLRYHKLVVKSSDFSGIQPGFVSQNATLIRPRNPEAKSYIDLDFWRQIKTFSFAKFAGGNLIPIPFQGGGAFELTESVPDKRYVYTWANSEGLKGELVLTPITGPKACQFVRFELTRMGEKVDKLVAETVAVKQQP